MTNLEIHNMLCEHRRNVLRLVDIDPDLNFGEKMKLLGYAKKIRHRMDKLASNIYLEFTEDVSEQTHNISRISQESNCPTVGHHKHSDLEGN